MPPPGARCAPRLPAPEAGEPPDDYLARLRDEQRRLDELIEALERGLDRGVAPAVLPPHRPAPEPDPAWSPPAFERRVRGPDRRTGPGDRRRAPGDRRSGVAKPRLEPAERRDGSPDRRFGRPTRRFGHDRRRPERRLLPGGSRLDPALVFWAVNVLCWAAVAIVALLFGAR